MADVREQIPGWRDALRRERDAHDSAFAFPVDTIAGFTVRHMSLLDMAQLVEMGCPFVVSVPSETDFFTDKKLRESAAVMVAFMCEGFDRRASFIGRIRNRLTIRSILKLRTGFLYDELVSYHERTFMDQIGGSGKPDPISKWSSTVDYIDLIASEYGWSADAILNMPYRHLIQYCRRILKRVNPDFSVPSISDELVAKRNRELNRKRREQLQS